MRIRYFIFFLFLASLSFADEDCDICSLSDIPVSSFVKCDKDGFCITSTDDFFCISVTTLLQADARFVIPDYIARGANNFFIRRARFIIDGRVGSGFSYRLTPDFSLGGSTHLFDAWIHYAFSPGLGLRFGKVRPPLGLERLLNEGDLKFIQRGLPSNLVPIREIGIMVCGDVYDKRLEYEIGIFNGTHDLGLSVSDNNNAKDLEARFFFFPFKKAYSSVLDNLAFGCGGSWGVHSGGNCIAGDCDGPELPLYITPGFLLLFRYRPFCVADGAQWRLIPQGYWYYGPWGLLWECALSSLKVKNKEFDIETPISNKAWQIQFSYEITGEKNSFGRIIPLTTFDLCKGTWGGFEFVARYQEMFIDPDAFPIYADPDFSVQTIRSAGIGFNWYPNVFVKISADYELSRFKRGAPDGHDRTVEHLFLFQGQVRF